MKKLYTLFGSIIMAITVMSCTGNYVCRCVTIDPVTNAQQVNLIRMEYSSFRPKRDARKVCLEQSASAYYPNTNTTCTFE